MGLTNREHGLLHMLGRPSGSVCPRAERGQVGTRSPFEAVMQVEGMRGAVLEVVRTAPMLRTL